MIHIRRCAWCGGILGIRLRLFQWKEYGGKLWVYTDGLCTSCEPLMRAGYDPVWIKAVRQKEIARVLTTRIDRLRGIAYGMACVVICIFTVWLLG